MDVKILRDEALLKEFDVTVSVKEIESQIEKKLVDIAPEVKVTGFRPGKVPLAVVRQRYGDSAHREVLEDLVPKMTSDIIKEHGLRPAMTPRYDVSPYERGEPFKYTLKIEVLPEISDIKFDDISLEKYDVTFDDTKVEESLKNLAAEFKDYKPLSKRKDVKAGDVAVIDFKGFKGDTPFPGGEAEDYSLEIGSKSFIDGFEDALIGKKVGESCSINLRFPDNYGSKELAGQDVRFDVTIKSLQEAVPMDISDKLAEKVGLKTLDELKKAFQDRLKSEYQSVARTRTKQQLLDALDARHTFAVPEGMIELEFKQICHQLESQLSDAGKEKKADLEKEWEKEYKPIAARRVRLGLLLAEIAQLNNLQVSNKELNDEILRRAQSFPGQENQVIDYFRNNAEALSSLKAPILEEKVVDFLMGKVKMTEVSMDIDELLKLVKEENDENAGGEDKKTPTKKEKTKKA